MDRLPNIGNRGRENENIIGSRIYDRPSNSKKEVNTNLVIFEVIIKRVLRLKVIAKEPY